MTSHPTTVRTERGLAACFALVAGYLDGYGLLVLGTYVSFMSGNTTMTGVRTGQYHLNAAYPAALAIGSFVFGSFAGNLVHQSKSSQANRVLAALISFLIAVVALLHPHTALSIALSIALLSAAMGMLNPALSKVGTEPVSLTFMTGTLSRIGGHLASAVKHEALSDPQDAKDSHLSRARLDASMWLSFLAGAVLAGILVSHFRVWSPLLPCLVMLALAVFGIREEIKAKA